MSEVAPAGDERFADLVDELLQRIQDGVAPDLEQVRRAYAGIEQRVPEAWELACSLAGRRSTSTPTLAGYEVLREIGHGGMGAVYLARHESLGREVALKVLPNSVWQSSRVRLRFLAEARALARLQHDHIVRIHRVLDHGSLLAFEMEFVDGPSLQQVLTHLRVGPRPVTMVGLAGAIGVATDGLRARSVVEFFVRLGAQMARALAHAHAAGLVHRDVKPGNILLRADGKPLLADFGLAHAPESDLTRTNCFVGTPTYAAPEQLRSGAAIDARADVYGLAVTLYEAIGLQVPFAGRSTAEVLRDIEAGNIRPLRAVAPQAPRDLETVLAKAMEPDPERRYRDATAFADDLERILSLQPVLARPVGPLRRAIKAVRRNRRQVLSGLVGALLVVAFAVPMARWAQAGVRAQERAAAAVRAARLALIDAVGPALQRRAADPSMTLLGQALGSYEQALADVPADQEVRYEHAVLRAALWLRRASPQRRDDVAAVLASADIDAVTRPLPALAADVVRELAAARLDVPALRTRLATATIVDRQLVGLLGFLLGEVPLCESAWASTPIDAASAPLLATGLGLLDLVDGRADRAYVQLFHAHGLFPESAEIALQLANAALAVGDVEKARQWGARVPDLGPDDPRRVRRERLQADLAAAAGDLAAARAVHTAHAVADPTDPEPRHRLAGLALASGDRATATRLLEELCQGQPNSGRYRLELAQLALERGDIAAYLGMAIDVVAVEPHAGSTMGSRADRLQILRLGGLDELFTEGLERAGLPRPLHRTGMTRPIWRDLPRARPADVQAGVRAMAAGRRAQALPDPSTWRDLAVVVAFARHVPGLAGLGATVVPAWVWGGLGCVHARPVQLAIDRVLRLRQRWQLARQPMIQPLLVGCADHNLVFAHAVQWSTVAGGRPVLLIGSMPRNVDASPGMVQVCDAEHGEVLAELRADAEDVLFGFAVADIGDLDGDGQRDWAVGAPLGRPGDAGRAFVFSGRTCEAIRSWSGVSAGFGVAVASAGDWDRDGVPDVAIGVSPELRNQAALGEVRIHSGRSGQELFGERSDRSGVWYGSAVARVDDVDGDGHPELLVGGNHGDAPGLVCLLRGGDGSRLQTWFDGASGSAFGAALCGVGDVDGDGAADVAVGAHGMAAGVGRVLVYSGRTGRSLHELNARRAGELFGASLSRVPDLDGDRIAELAVASPRGGRGHGEVRIFSLRTGAELLALDNATDDSSFASSVEFGHGRLAIAGASTAGLGTVFVTELRP